MLRQEIISIINAIKNTTKMKTINLSNGDVIYQCDICKQIFFTPCDTHERHWCHGPLKGPQAFRVYATLHPERGIMFGIQRSMEASTEADKIESTIEGGEGEFLFFDDNEHNHFFTTVYSSSVLLEDIPTAVAAVQKVFLEKLMDLAKILGGMPDFINVFTDAMRKIQNEHS